MDDGENCEFAAVFMIVDTVISGKDMEWKELCGVKLSLDFHDDIETIKKSIIRHIKICV